MHILFADKFPQKQLQQIQNFGHETRYQPDLQAEDLPGVITEANALVVRSTRVEKDCD